MRNKVLYEALRHEFGTVRIANEGAAASYHAVRGDDGTWWGQIDASGEEYHICCPFCGDQRFRLYLSYLYGRTLQENGHTVRFGGGLAWCFNETTCLDDVATRRQLYRRLMSPDVAQMHVSQSEEEENPPPALPLPPRNIIPLDQLPPRHKAVRYVQERGYDARELSLHFGVGYCPYEREMPLAENRLFIPVYNRENALVGGQCRLLYTPTGSFPRKYWNLPRSRFADTLYNIRLAWGAPTVVVVEGATDVWRVGVHGVGILKGVISSKQEQLLLERWAEIVVIPDADIPKNELEKRAQRAKREKLEARLQCWRSAHPEKRIYLVDLPEGKDPGDCTRDELWDYIDAARTAAESD